MPTNSQDTPEAAALRKAYHDLHSGSSSTPPSPTQETPADLTEAMDALEDYAAHGGSASQIHAARSALLALYMKLQAKAEGK